MKELNIIQAMEMPVGTEFEVVFNDGFRYEQGNKVAIEKCEDGSKLVWKVNGYQVTCGSDLIAAKFIQIQKSVSFMEAIKASAEGETIRVTVEDKEYTYYPQKSKFLELRDKTTHGGISTSEILEGKWYIEESEEN